MAKSMSLTVNTILKPSPPSSAPGAAAGYFPNQLPVASFTLTPLYPIAGQTIYFDATASYDPDGTITSYAWDFGDVQTSFGATPVHAFASPGTYHVSLTVTDNGSAMT